MGKMTLVDVLVKLQQLDETEILIDDNKNEFTLEQVIECCGEDDSNDEFDFDSIGILRIKNGYISRYEYTFAKLIDDLCNKKGI